MTPSAQHAPEPWGDHPQEFDLLAQEPTPPLPVDPGAPYDQLAPADDGTAYQAETGEFVDEGDVDTRLEGPADDSTEYDVGAGMPARGVILSATAATAVCAGLDFALTGELTFFFDLCFVVISLVAAMGVLRRDLFTAGVLPPLVFGLTIAAIAVLSPTTFIADGGLESSLLAGLAAHAAGLVAGYAVALLTVAGRLVAASGD